MDARDLHAGARRAAEAVHGRAKKVNDWNERAVELAVIRDLGPPMIAEIFTSGQQLEEGSHFLLTQFVRWWDLNYALWVGDQLVMTRVADDQSWLVFDVHSPRDVNAGMRPSRPGVTPEDDMRAAQTVVNDPELTFNIPVSLNGTDSNGDGVTVSGNVVAHAGDIVWQRHVVKKLEVYDKDGAKIGYVPVFASLP